MIFNIVILTRAGLKLNFPFIVDYNEPFSERKIYPTQSMFKEKYNNLYEFIRDIRNYVDQTYGIKRYRIFIPECDECPNQLTRFEDIMFANKLVKDFK